MGSRKHRRNHTQRGKSWSILLEASKQHILGDPRDGTHILQELYIWQPKRLQNKQRGTNLRSSLTCFPHGEILLSKWEV